MSDTERKTLSLFSETAGSVKTLRQSYRKKSQIPEIEQFKKELVGVSDRASITLLGSALDDALIYRIAMALPQTPTDDELDYIFRFEGPLGTFSARMEQALLWGVIEDTTYQELDLFRELRNAAAHSKMPLSFQDAAVSNVVKRLASPRGLFPLPPKGDEDLKAFFIIEGLFIIQALYLGGRDTARAYLKAELAKSSGKSPSPDTPMK